MTIIAPIGNETVNPEDVLKCLSNGNPPPYYEWIDLMTMRATEGPQWTVSDECSNKQSVLIIQCTAKINALGKVYSSTVIKTFTVINKKCTGTYDGVVHMNCLMLCYPFAVCLDCVVV